MGSSQQSFLGHPGRPGHGYALLFLCLVSSGGAYFHWKQNLAAEAKVRIERRGGRILRGMEKNVGGRPINEENQSHDVTGFPTLSDLGIEYALLYFSLFLLGGAYLTTEGSMDLLTCEGGDRNDK